MNSFRQFAETTVLLPAMTGWYLADLGEARGRQELYHRRP